MRRGPFAGRKRMTLFIAAPVENRSIVMIALSLEGRRLTNSQRTPLRVYFRGDGSPRCKLSSWLANLHTMILISKLLGGRRVTPCDERAVAQSGLGLSVQKRPSRRIKNGAARRAQHRIARRSVP